MESRLFFCQDAAASIFFLCAGKIEVGSHKTQDGGQITRMWCGVLLRPAFLKKDNKKQVFEKIINL